VFNARLLDAVLGGAGYTLVHFLHLVLFSLCAFLLTVFVLRVLLSYYVHLLYLCVSVVLLCVFVVLCVYCCSYFRCRTAG